MPSVSQFRIKPGSGTVSQQTSTTPNSSAVTGAPTISQISFTVQSPSVGVQLFDSSGVSGNNITLALRNMVAGLGISITNHGGVITVTNTVQANSGGSDDDGLNNPSVKIGQDSVITGFSPVAIGYYAIANGGTASTAIGSNARSYGSNATAIGYSSAAKGGWSFAGAGFSYAGANYDVALGFNSYAKARGGVAIGSYSHVQKYGSIAIGDHAYADSYYAIAIGKGAGVTSGNYFGIAIGYQAKANENAIAMGEYTVANHYNSVAIGHNSIAHGNGAVALGNYAQSGGVDSLALGSESQARYAYSVAISATAVPLAIGSTTIGAYPNGFVSVNDHYQRFVAQTQGLIKASASWGDGHYLARVSFNTPGTAGNIYHFQTITAGISTTLNLGWDGSTLTLNFGTDGSGDLDDSQNTLDNIAALFPAHGFEFSFTDGYGSTIVSFVFSADFSGGSEGDPVKIMTADGDAPGVINIPAIWEGSAATLTARIVGIGSNIFDTNDDIASFILNPLLLYRKNGQTYVFVGTPTFVMENSTEGAADWPVSYIDNDRSDLVLTVTNETNSSVYWMANLKFEASE